MYGIAASFSSDMSESDTDFWLWTEDMEVEDADACSK